ncbi:unnamed protein product [Arabidopsis lyrata]|uniref:B3 domain-containing protein At5g60142 isoform X2 n=1 Tax=Arabidopsis lyrata subsp. lyrata TaxID=81972 RepID=UPI000A29AB01|nr:B3 domain-containing protein At5g60142 isoform X2 [Arabidopsis lyrata subsp. lyrata]CAH8280312.1 unnamed protein product [Arabidopsis lyrata]|eukprot:XP_020888769.1 B3 domain-containing protein At5g60142 isoform X2 [Arabidopsis lyrata subsp. lyrata]
MNRGNSGGNCLPKFFKVYLPDESGDDLELPISFNSFLPKSLPKNVIVRSIYGNIWKMALKKCCGHVERFTMVNGWKKIVKNEDLKGGEFLEFEFDGSWCFNFCIYGRATFKKLRSSVQIGDIEDESDGEDDKHSDDDHGIDDQDYGDEDKSSESIIVLDDDDISDVQDYNEEDTSSEDITALDDADNDDIKDVQDYGEEDISSEDIIVIDDDDHADDEKERWRGVKKERKEKGSSGEHDRHYLDNHMNPFFTVNQHRQIKYNLLRIPTKVITKSGLHFPEFINLIDPLEKMFGKLKRKVEGQTIKGFRSIIRRNNVKLTDKVICELVKEMDGLVREIKVHVIRG